MHAARLCRDRLCRLALAVVLLSATGAAAQMPPSPYVAPTPTPNPSSSLVVPPPGEVPVSPAVRSSPFSPGANCGHQSGGQSGAQRASRLGLSPAAASLLRAIAPALRRSAQRSMPAIDRRRSSSAQSAGCRPLRLVDFRPYALLPMRRIHASNLSTQPERKTRVVSSAISWASSMTPGLNWK